MGSSGGTGNWGWMRYLEESTVVESKSLKGSLHIILSHARGWPVLTCLRKLGACQGEYVLFAIF